ncbi:MAG: type II secretion system F family protein [bacterium]|nr:type II secretion system F family protein [bacterium]MDD5354390.1 type II secretion system F family protein [bacterium]MDD5755857.1 type II secretion system F family protein [bacterium]
MPYFKYSAKSISGELISDIIEADNDKIVVEHIHSRGFYPVSVTEEKSRSKSFMLRKRIGASDLLIFTRQLTDLLKGGLPIAKAVELAFKQTENQNLKEIILDLNNQLHKGTSFSEALSKYPQVFNSLYIGLIKAGESSGLLETSLERVTQYQEKEQDLMNKIKAALAYPAAMLLVGLATVTFLLVFVIPRFAVIFQDMEQLLPLPTRILIFLSSALQHWWWLFLLVIIFSFILVKRYLDTAAGRKKFDRFKLKIFIIGKIMQQEMVVRFTRTLGILLANGIPLINALEMVKKVVGNTVITEEIDRIYEEIKVGKGLVEPLSKSKVFPTVLSDLVAAGQEVGSMENSLLKAADAYETKVENTVKIATSLMEPLVILGMGLVVGFIVLAMLLPIFEISGAIK